MPYAEGVPDDVDALIAACIESVEQVEILLLLRGTRRRTWGIDELSRQLRRTPHSVRLRLRSLIAHGLVALEDGRARYAAASSIDRAVRMLATMYRQRRTALIDRIFTERPDPMRSFADAFRLRDDADDC
jgi:hypothetical protein